MAELNTDVRFIKGVGEQKAKSLGKLGIGTLGDLISYFPRDYEDRRFTGELSSAVPNAAVCVRAVVVTTPRLSHIRQGMDIVRLRIADDGGAADVTFFNQPYVKNSLRVGETYVFFGKLTIGQNRAELVNPVFEKDSPELRITGRIMPVYRLTAAIGQAFMARCVREGLAAAESFPDFLPESIRENEGLEDAAPAYRNIHFPQDAESLAAARKRLIFEELFVLACTLRRLRESRERKTGIVLKHGSEEFLRSLPFEPTGAQRRVAASIEADMASGRPMNRLIQGDVGSGKTLCAAAAIFTAAKCGYQTAFMAPTGILAEQHFETLRKMLGPFGIRVDMLTGGLTAKEKREVKARLRAGETDVIVGTHALIYSGVDFNRLALVITDEQHRFGVNQRSVLTEKGEAPHVLVMSATPIPRTLALIFYGDLDVSIIDELPPGRQSVDTFCVDEKMRPRIEKFVRRLVGEGRQVFIVCPMVEESEALNVKAAEKYASELSENVFPELRVALVHGKMKPADKERIMAAFVRGETDILVATTVIEVGVDVPNAALMIVENAERFGLSQLHQLRGRVGRGRHKSYCVLFCEDGKDNPRMATMCATCDGFKISEEDLKLRGPGDFFGSRQHGLPEMKIADLMDDAELLPQAQRAAESLLEKDPLLEMPEQAALKRRIQELISKNEGTIN